MNVIKLRILIWGDYPELSGWVQGKHKGPYRRETRRSESEIGRSGIEDLAMLLALKVEEGTRGQEVQAASRGGKGKIGFFPRTA